MYLIIGASGFLGSYIIKSILEETKESVIAVARNIEESTSERVNWIKCDISVETEVNALCEELKKKETTYNVIYLAAYHHPDLVAKNPKIAWDVNITALARFLNCMEDVRCFFYSSTDTVYGNGSTDVHFKETDVVDPVNLYGKHKVLAEQLVTGYGYNVVRYPFLIAPSLVKSKKHFYDQILETIEKGDTMEMFADSYRSTLDFGTAASLLVKSIEQYTKDFPKIVNIAGDDDLSKYDVGCMIAKKHGISTDLVKPISMAGSQGIFGVKRAQSALMDNTKVKEALGLAEIKINL
ncbi:sugar nucleotide-binding protein [Anaerosporobacter faecicola]|uniref:sugar nucleotide-binding protein n=1 Tax=Anaerosporobacter faecicola TaxID=2718714 RepID=UPI0014394A62|nr:sugar nucleotide-binding protein [Anaerosporobacter faecicola]